MNSSKGITTPFSRKKKRNRKNINWERKNQIQALRRFKPL